MGGYKTSLEFRLFCENLYSAKGLFPDFGDYYTTGGGGYKVIQVGGYKVRQVGDYKVSLSLDFRIWGFIRSNRLSRFQLLSITSKMRLNILSGAQ